MWKRFVKEYLAFSRKERIGIYMLLVIIALCLLSPFFFTLVIHEKPNQRAIEIPADEFSSARDSLKPKIPSFRSHWDGKSKSNYSKDHFGHIKGTLFVFDPNTLSSEGWQRLGIRERTVSTIKKYLDRGGHFYQPEDISKIWGLHPDEVKRLIPYVNIATIVNKLVHIDDKPRVIKKYGKPDIESFDINRADSDLLIKLPGIGVRLAKRIIGFRESIGGFSSVEQVGETYALPDSTFQKIKGKFFIGTGALKKININKASADDLKRHPYIKFALANAVVQYRNQHGPFKDIADLKKIMLVTDDAFRKLSPYLEISDPEKK